MKCVTLLFVLAVLNGCAAAPRASDAAASDVREIAWTKGMDAEPFRDQHGVCHTFSQDHQGALSTLGTQLKACFERELPTATVISPAARSVKVAWQKVPASSIDALFAESTSRRLVNATGHRRTAAVFSVRGFYEYEGDTCRVVVSEHREDDVTLGHEFKHCVDGEFHDERGVWRHYRAG